MTETDYFSDIFITFAPVRIGVRRHETKNIRPASADRHTRTPRTFQPTRLMGEQNVIRLRGVTIYHTDDPFGSRSEKKLLQQGELILSDLNFDINAGEFVYLIGRVGSGKSSLLKTLYAELQLIEGEGYVAGFDLRKLKRRDIPMLRRRIGIVFQDYQLLTDRNVFMNLYYVMKATGWKNESEIRKRIDEVLKVVSLEAKGYKMPFELSGGEQQRLVIARALLNRQIGRAHV